jgi:hypothetical protein
VNLIERRRERIRELVGQKTIGLRHTTVLDDAWFDPFGRAATLLH